MSEILATDEDDPSHRPYDIDQIFENLSRPIPYYVVDELKIGIKGLLRALADEAYQNQPWTDGEEILRQKIQEL